MAINVIKNDFRSSKMAAAAILQNKSPKNKVAYWSKMTRNAIESDFRSFKMVAGGHFVKRIWKQITCWSEMTRKVIESDFGAYIA